MVGKLVIRGIFVGILAGLIAFGWAKVFGEPSVETAIAFESAHKEHQEHEHASAPDAHVHDDPELFSRPVQSGLGLLTGIVAVGASLGGLFAILFAYANGRMGTLGAGPTSALLALLGLLSFYVVPALKYPANPPSVGEADTIQLRTGLYFLLMAISLAATLGALALRQSLARRHSGWNASLMAAAVYLFVIATAFLALPAVNEVPPGFPAATLWDFRLASLGIQTVLWMSLGLMFGYVGAWTTGSPTSSDPVRG